ncbi:MAG: transcriptional regulator, LysR family, partial [Conexibacter sp.]|nr:transcriptional regulator, LysR family [Conexibacter sp.]
DFMMAAHLASGALVTVLDDYPSLSWPIHALYPKNRHLLPKVRVFLDFLATRVVARRSSLTAPSVQAPRGHRTR